MHNNSCRIALLFLVCAALSAQTASPVSRAIARAEEFTISKITVLDTAASEITPVFSRDGAWLAYIHSSGVLNKPGTLVIVSLPAGDRRRTIECSELFENIAWSFDATRIFAVDANRNGFIVDIGTGRTTPLGRTTIPWPRASVIIWPDARSVYFLTRGGAQRFDLETLSSSGLGNADSANATLAQFRKTPVDHPYVTLGLTSVQVNDISSRQVIAAINRDGSYTRVLYSNFHTATFSPNAAHVVIRINAQLLLLTTGTRLRPRLALEATIMPLPNPIQPSDLVGIRANLARGNIVYADVFRPRINPLNQRLVGAEGQSKGLVRITRVGDDGTLEARFVREVDGYPATGDVLQGFWTPEPNQTNFRSVSAVVGPLKDLPASPIETAVAKEPVTADPDTTVLDAFDAYIAGNTAGLTSLMSDEGIRNAKVLCFGDAASCLKSNYSGRGSMTSRTAKTLSLTIGHARVRLMSNWQNAARGGAKATLCQTYNLSLTETGWRIDMFDGPGTCQ